LEAATSTDVPSQPEKSSKLLYRRRGCKILLLAIFLMPAWCYAVLWLYARFGGEWATAFPVPPDSRLIASIYQPDYRYTNKTSIYANQSTPEALREWFVDSGVAMTPIPLNAEGTSFIESDKFYGTPYPYYRFASDGSMLHRFAATITHGWFDDMMPNCQRVRVYKSISLAANDFPTIDFRNAETVFSVTTCWPNLD
jgi:hypothetical protein